MDAKVLQSKLIDYTISRAGFDEFRGYIGLSQLDKCLIEVWNQFYKGYSADNLALLKCYKGYQMEADMIRRLQMVTGDDFIPGASRNISAYDGLLQGHPDGWLNGKPLDIKSVAYDAYLPADVTAVSFKIKMQMQAYLYYAPASVGYLVFESRESGIIRVFEMKAERYYQKIIETKVPELIAAIRERRLPVCGCRRCRPSPCPLPGGEGKTHIPVGKVQ